MLLSDITIKHLCTDGNDMISPFLDHLVREENGEKIMSRGLSSYGYDVTLSRDSLIRLHRESSNTDLDPKGFREDLWREVKGDIRYITLAPGDYVLGHTVEYFKMPNNVAAICLGKSSYARLGLMVNVTPIEPGFEGQVVIELSNPTRQWIRVYLNEGIAQFMFLQGDVPCQTSYADRQGKYQGQKGITHARS